ncbi:hypothetical protein ESB00_08290 [Oleiharenicola lentus]|jgi:hypothetical protein|uniref:PIN-like domain-containing protein n=1 Tax=Oleiharenicola lentus TaxID=2508720 RepID=A0A4Q1CA47_9BACT|nr:PIN domain-containing protein [Oleiharenicola lentus]RXK55868.1 hypothetical protein ESB00_08290 [Oleiharenicola lentus]
MIPFEHIVLVDFENVPDVDFAGIEGKPVRVVLLIGTRQQRLDLALVRQIHRLNGQIELVEVGVAGRSAFDLALAYQLGLAVKEHPQAQFHIVSQAEDFEPLLRHLASRGMDVTRHVVFPSLYLPIPVRRDAPVVRLEKLIEQIRQGTVRPRKRSTLEHVIATFDGNDLTKEQVKVVLEQLIRQRVLLIDDRDKVGYP